MCVSLLCSLLFLSRRGTTMVLSSECKIDQTDWRILQIGGGSYHVMEEINPDPKALCT